MVCILTKQTPNLQVNAIPYAVAISACEDGGHWLQALAILQEFCLQPEQGRMAYNAAASTCEKVCQSQMLERTKGFFLFCSFQALDEIIL